VLKKIKASIDKISKMTGGAEQINDSVKHVNEICIQNRERINILANDVARFKV